MRGICRVGVGLRRRDETKSWDQRGRSHGDHALAQGSQLKTGISKFKKESQLGISKIVRDAAFSGPRAEYVSSLLFTVCDCVHICDPKIAFC